MGNSKGQGFPAQEKLKVLEEGRQSGVMISEVCRRHQISHAQFYRWERLAREGALMALAQGKVGLRRNGKGDDKLIEEVQRLRSVVVELSTENLALKKGLYV